MKLNAVTTDQLADDLKSMAHHADTLLKEIGEDLSEKGSAARKRLNNAIERAKETCNDLQDKAGKSLKVADKTIRNHPYESLGVAVGVGVLLGVLLARK